MVVKIEDIKKICQEPRRQHDTKYGIYIARNISRYITWLMLHTSITANGFTLFFLIFGIFLCAFFLKGSYVYNLIGMLMFNIWYILDHVDGEIARYRKTVTTTGIYLDVMAHYIVHPAMFICIGIGLYNKTHLIPLVNDIRENILYRRAKATKVDKTELKNSQSVAKRLFSIAHSFCTFPNIIIYLTIFAIIDFLSKEMWFYTAVIILTLVSAFVWIIKLAYIVFSKQLDSAYSILNS